MAFRDEGEALRHRAETAERQLEAAEKELGAHRGQAERLACMEEELRQARELLNRVQDRLDGIKPSPRAHRTRLWFGLGLGTLLLLGAAGGAAVFVREPAGTGRGVPAAETVRQETWQADIPPSSPSAPSTAEATEPSPIEKTVRWKGRVSNARGQALAVGTECSIDAVLRSSSKHDVSISCGGRVLYRSTDPLNGLSTTWMVGAVEVPAREEGTSQSLLSLSDMGPRRGGRPEAVVDTVRGIAHVQSGAPGAYRVELAVDAYSEPYQGVFDPRHKHHDLAFQERVRTKATVVKVTGPAPVKIGQACEASLDPDFGPSCRALVRCGQVALYGGPGMGNSSCKVENGRPASFDEPAFHLRSGLKWDVAAGQLLIDMSHVGETWEVELTANAGAGG